MMDGQELFVSAAAVVVVLSLCVTSILANRRITALEKMMRELQWMAFQSSMDWNELEHRVHSLTTPTSPEQGENGLPRVALP